jgi:hypothetical protein
MFGHCFGLEHVAEDCRPSEIGSVGKRRVRAGVGDGSFDAGGDGG